MTAGRQRGFALADLLLACLIVCLAGAELFRILSACGCREAQSSWLTAAAGVAESVLGREESRDRSLVNPEGAEVSPGQTEEFMHAGRRAFKVSVRKEEVEGCPGLTRKWITVTSDGAMRQGQKKGTVSAVAGSYDPF